MRDALKEEIGLRDLTELQVTTADDQSRYDDWKRKKVEAALKQSEDRSAMHSAKSVWDRFGFER